MIKMYNGLIKSTKKQNKKCKKNNKKRFKNALSIQNNNHQIKNL